MDGLLLGLRQPFPMRCGTCREQFRRGDEIVKFPVLWEGEPRWQGRLLWATWLCVPCAVASGRYVQNDVVIEDEEPSEVRDARLQAERDLNRSVLATRRAIAVNMARAHRDELVRR